MWINAVYIAFQKAGGIKCNILQTGEAGLISQMSIKLCRLYECFPEN